MKWLLPTLLCLVFPAGLLAQTNPPADATPTDKDKCSVSGTVLRQDTGEPLSKAKVTLVNHEKWNDSVFDSTDSQGHFLLDDLSCISYSMQASHSGFVESSYGQRKPTDPGAILTLVPGQKITGLVFKLQRAAVITGHVFDENGDLAEGAFVRVIRPTGQGKRRAFWEAGSGTTNDLGEFRIYDLKPGRYYIAASYDPWSSRAGFDPRPGHRLLKKGYPVAYYPGTIDPSRAQVLPLNPGDELSSIDFRMQLTSMNTVSGKILNLPGKSAQNRTNVYLLSHGSDLSILNFMDSFQSGVVDGTFAIYRVPPGSYYLQAVYFDLGTGAPNSTRRELEVTGADVGGLTLAFAPSMNLGGRVIWDRTKSGDFSSLTAELSSTDEYSPGPQPAEVKPDGSFLFRNVSEGDYRPVVASTNSDCYVKFARLESTPMVDGKLSLRSGSDNSLEYVVSCRAPHVEGTVLTSDSLPAAGVYVVLVPEVRLREDLSNYGETRTDQNGHFLLKGIKPGDYELFSWDAVEEGDWFAADFLKPFEEKGVSVHLEEGDRKTANLTLIDASAGATSKP